MDESEKDGIFSAEVLAIASINENLASLQRQLNELKWEINYGGFKAASPDAIIEVGDRSTIIGNNYITFSRDSSAVLTPDSLIFDSRDSSIVVGSITADSYKGSTPAAGPTGPPGVDGATGSVGTMTVGSLGTGTNEVTVSNTSYTVRSPAAYSVSYHQNGQTASLYTNGGHVILNDLPTMSLSTSWTVEFFVLFSVNPQTLGNTTLFSCNNFSQAFNINIGDGNNGTTLGIPYLALGDNYSGQQGGSANIGLVNMLSTVPSTGVWHHLAFACDSQYYYAYGDGTLIWKSSTARVNIYTALGAGLLFGALHLSGGFVNYATSTYFSNLRVSSFLRYPGSQGATYTIPTSPYTVDNNTVLINTFGTVSANFSSTETYYNLVFTAGTGGLVAAYLAGGGVTTVSVDNDGNVIRTVSDARAKRHITSIEADCTSRLAAITPVSFQWSLPQYGDSVDYGFTAQDIQEHFSSDLVYSVPFNDIPDALGFDQTKLIPFLVKAIQELTARITALENASASCAI